MRVRLSLLAPRMIDVTVAKQFAIGDEQHGDFVYHTQDGGRAVILGNKLVFDNGSFEKPIVNNVLAFFDDVTMSSTIDYINRMGYIK